jgi:8-oxoguanine deaminase
MSHLHCWIKNPLAVYTGTDQCAANGVVVCGSRITGLVAAGTAPAHYDTCVDASGLVLTPGLINTHHHFFQTLTRALPAALNKELFPWLLSLYRVWVNLDEAMLAAASRLAMAELLLSGCTTAADHHYLFPPGLEHAIDIQAAAAADMGLRAVLTRGSMSLSEKDGGLPPDRAVQPEQFIIDDSQRLIQRYHDSRDGAMLQIALAPCSPFSITPELMRESARMAQRFDVRLHTHLCETLDEETFCLERFGLRPVDYLEDVGWLGPRTWLAHGIHFSTDEIARLGRAGVGIAHCPSSNMLLASGICRARELEQAGCPVGLAVDGSASNDGSTMINELRQALFIQRLRYGSAQVSHLDVWRYATAGSAACLGRSDIGSLAVGKQADLALFSLDAIRFAGAHDPLAALVLCGAQQATHVMVAGQWQVRDGQLVDKDVAELIGEQRRQARRLVG